jgi:hypothetical protein
VPKGDPQQLIKEFDEQVGDLPLEARVLSDYHFAVQLNHFIPVFLSN